MPEEVRQIIQNAKNDDKIEEREHERRSKNIIIHGADEYGQSVDEVKELDKGYIRDIFKHLGIKSKPLNIVRLGDPKKSTTRPIKITMNTMTDKELIKSNLNKLKGSEDIFGKISITDDYTRSERDELKKWIDNAKKKSLADKDFNYKVRGDPKNGLRLLQVKKV